MKTDEKLKSCVNHITTMRAYDDDLSILIRCRMIAELNEQIKNIVVHRHSSADEKFRNRLF
jgi:hypothetical protein